MKTLNQASPLTPARCTGLPPSVSATHRPRFVGFSLAPAALVRAAGEQAALEKVEPWQASA